VLKSLSWDDVRYFLAVASAGSLSAAARGLGVEHSTLSRRLGALEQKLGLSLFQRTRDGVELSQSGVDLLGLARAAEERMLAVERKLEALAEGGTRVRLATSGILATGLLAPHVGELVSARPGLGLELLVSRGLVRLTRGEADLALRLRPPGAYVAEPSVIASVLARVRWAAYATSRSAAERGVIEYSGTTRPGAGWIEARRSAGPELAVDDVPSALALARAGLGVAVLPCFLADADASLGFRSELLDEHHLVLAMPRGLRQLGQLRAVVKWLKQLVTGEKPRLAGAL
jgi:DNA-binding transcriptional LysR family regulator